MAKTKRVIRRVEPVAPVAFDEQLWPVNLAILVLGSFLIGTILAYLRFDDERWYANATYAIAAVVTVLGGAMIGLLYVDNRQIRRAAQLAAVVSLIVHCLFLIVAIRSRLFGDLWKERPVARDLIPPRREVVVPDYHRHHFVNPEQRPREDYEKPVETITPQPEPEQVKREELKPEPQPTEPKNTPTPEEKQTPQPALAQRQTPAETVPRFSEQSSQLSRRQTQNTPRPNQAAEAATVSPPSPQKTPNLEAQASAVNRQATEAPVKPAALAAEPTAANVQTDMKVSRRETETTTQPDTTARPTLPRQIAQPQQTPRTTLAANETPSVSKQTSPTELTARTTAAEKQTTASPQVAQKTPEPTPDSPTQITANSQRRESPSETRPTVAQSPESVQNQRTRVTNRPETNTTAQATTSAATTKSEASATPTVQPTAIARRSTDQPTDRPTPNADAAASTTPTVEPSTVTMRRDQSAPSPAATMANVTAPSLARQTNKPGSAPTTQAEAAQPVASARQTEAGDVAPTSVATRKQATSASEVAKSNGDPSPAASPQPTPSALTNAAGRRAADNNGPQSEQNSTNPNAGRKTAAQLTNVPTNAADVVANSAPRTSNELQPQPSSATVTRQTGLATQGSPAITTLDSPQASSSTQIAVGSTKRSNASSQPALDNPTGQNNLAARSPRVAASAASPTAVESPAASIATQANGLTMEATKMAIDKGSSGIAGGGRSANLDQTSPADKSPAMVASGAARRAQASQNTPEGAALSPSSSATLSRALAGADRPSATTQAQTIDTALAGSAQASELTASSSASMARASSNAPAGAVSAAVGNLSADFGPTQIVADRGGGRAGGGGQSDLNPNASQGLVLARAGGAPQASLQSAEVADATQAPAGGKSGNPAVEINALATTTARTQAGGESPVSGGPQLAGVNAPADATSAPMLADANVSRAGATEALAAAPGGGATNLDDEEEKERARRLARAAAGGGPQLALNGPVAVDAPVAAPGDGSGTDGMVAANAVAVATTKANSGDGLPSAGQPTTAEVGTAGPSGAVAGNVTVNRAEASMAPPGAVVAGGGSNSPVRAATGPQFNANTQADVASLAGAPISGGAPQGIPFEARGIADARATGGVAGTSSSEPAGTFAGNVAADGPVTQVTGEVKGSRAASNGTESGPTTTAIANTGAPTKRTGTPGATAGLASNGTVAIPQASAAVAQANMDHLAGVNMGPMSRQATGALSVELAMVDGPGGLGAEVSADVGIAKRPASADSVQVQISTARFVRQNVGGLPAMATSAIVSADSFRRRDNRGMGKKDAGGGGPGPKTEESIELGLTYLAKLQAGDGRWSLQGHGQQVALASDTAATGLALLSFQGAGYHHREYKYKDNVRAALDYLVKNQKADGDLFVPLDDESNRSVWLYSHGIATLALCEAYGMTQDPALKEPAQKALNFIVASQTKDRGGWRYAPGVSADTSVTGWMMMALKSGELSGLTVPKETYAGISRWLEASQGSTTEKHMFRYNPFAPDTEQQRHGRTTTKTMTAVGLLMRLYSGWKRDNGEMMRGAEYLQQHPPQLGSLREPERDTYYWYYATQVMFHMGGPTWESWNKQLHPLLTNSQVRDGVFAGSWDPVTPVPDRWAPHAGRLYVTTMNLLSLEVYYRHLPLYEDTAK